MEGELSAVRIRAVYLTGAPTAYSFLPALIFGRGAFAAAELVPSGITPRCSKSETS